MHLSRFYLTVLGAVAGYLLLRSASAFYVELFSSELWADVMLNDVGRFDFEVVFWGVMVYPVLEELIFRGFAFEFLRRRIPASVAAVMVTVVFVTAHLVFGGGLSIFSALIIGVAAQILVLYGWRLRYAVLFHALFNLLVLVPKPAMISVFDGMGFGRHDFYIVLFWSMVLALSGYICYVLSIIKCGAENC